MFRAPSHTKKKKTRFVGFVREKKNLTLPLFSERTWLIAHTHCWLVCFSRLFPAVFSFRFILVFLIFFSAQVAATDANEPRSVYLEFRGGWCQGGGGPMMVESNREKAISSRRDAYKKKRTKMTRSKTECFCSRRPNPVELAHWYVLYTHIQWQIYDWIAFLDACNSSKLTHISLCIDFSVKVLEFHCYSAPSSLSLSLEF
jgi:hypothetical protein